MKNISNKYKLKQTHKIVQEAIHRVDPFGLLASGSPDDEFDSEINSIVKQLSRCNSSKDIAYTIARVLNSSFSENYTYENFEKESNIIYNNLSTKGLI